MKKEMLLGICLFVAAACEQLPRTEDTTSTPDTTYPLRFTVGFKEEVLPFPSTKSIPENTVAEPEISEPVAETVQFNQIEYLVYPEGETTPLKRRHYTTEDEDFGTVCDSLPEGTYRLAFLAHSSPDMSISEDNIFSADSVSDTFFLLKELTIVSDEEVTENVVLKRAVSRVEFIATDPVPSTLNQFDMEISDYPDCFDILKGAGVIKRTNPLVISHVYMMKDEGKTNTKHSFYTFVATSSASRIRVELNALDKHDEIYFHRTQEVRPQVNKIIRYKGKLYAPPTSNDSFTMEVDGKWDESEENDLLD